MVLKPDVVRERLLHLEEVVTRLEELQHLNPRQVQDNYRDSWAVERGLQVAAEIVFDVGNQILAAHFGQSAKTTKTSSRSSALLAFSTHRRAIG